jgi:hypothetical protein
MSVGYFANGLGQTLGDQLVTGINLVLLNAGSAFYVGATNASDTDGGLDPLRPLATVGQAITNASANDVIVLMDGFSQTFAGNLVIAKRLVLAAGGSIAGAPSVALGLAGGGISIQATTSDIEFRNIKFTAPTSSNAAPRVIVSGADCLFRGCRFEMNGNDAATAIVRLDAGGDRCRFENCTFVVTSTSVSSRPPAAILRNGAITRVYMKDCIIDGGTTGFDTVGTTGRQGAAIDFGTDATAGAWRIENLNALRGADVLAVFAANQSGFVQIPIATGSSKVFA